MCEINKASEVEAELHINMALEQEVSDLQLMANMLQLNLKLQTFCFWVLGISSVLPNLHLWMHFNVLKMLNIRGSIKALNEA